jgi:hypothetical protein
MRTNIITGLIKFLQALREERRGQDMLEYALLGAFAASVAIAVFPAIATTGGAFSQAISLLSVALSMTAGR